MRHQLTELRTAVELTNRRLDDLNVHLADQSRRIDAIREELSLRIDETNKRVDAVREELLGQIATLRSELTIRIDETNKRIDRLHEAVQNLALAVARREDQERLERRVQDLERELQALKQKVA